MSCPPPIARVLLEILARGLIRARGFAFAGESQKCAAETDHLHNLPHVLSDYCWERLQYYWEVERPCFLDKTPPEEQRRGYFFHDLWQELEPLVEAERPKSS